MQTAYSARPEGGTAPETSGSTTDSLRIQQCLEQVCASAEFARSERMISFLRVVTGHALEGRRNLLSERFIGRAVFGRPEDWDPSLDTIVRSEARRLRTKLDRYYEGPGRSDPIRIRIPKGGYAPEFDVLSPAQPEAAALRELLPAPAPGPSWRLALPAGVALAVLIAILVAGLLWLRHARLRPLPAAEAFTTTPFASEVGPEYSPAISPDGKLVAYVWDDSGSTPDIYLRALDSPAPHRLDRTAATRLFPSWSPDGRQLAFLQVTGDEVYVMTHSIADGSERRITRIAKQVGRWPDDHSPLLGNPGPIWTHDGSGLIVADEDVASGSGGLYRIGFDGRRTLLMATSGEDHDLYPRLSPDGKLLAYLRYSSHGVGELFLAPAAEGDARQLTFDKKTIQGLAWQTDGRSLLFASNRSGSLQLWSVAVDGSGLSPVTTNSSSASEPAVAPSGDWLIYVESSENWNIWRTPLPDARRAAAQRFLATSGRNYDPRYSPDGSHIAFVSDRSGSMELWVTDKEGKDPKQLTHLGSSWLGGISWSPRGDQIAFDARPQARSAIYLIASVGGEPRLLDRNPYEERMPCWSADGASIYFNSNRDGTVAIWKRSLADGTIQRITPHGMFAVAAGKNGIVYSSRTGEIWMNSSDGESAVELPEALRPAPVMSWFLQNQSLYLTQFDERTRDYTFLRYRNGRTTLLGASNGMLVPNAPDIAVSPDEKWLLYAQQDSSGSDLKIRRRQPPPPRP